ncbi:MAG: DUF721 domain-containing protein [Ignavibacteria bacterium]|jgi:hypothetical protein|nr:DUF721 domain-containing protein [Ignavibacteria bacterium]
MQRISEILNQFISDNEFLAESINLEKIKQIWQEDFPPNLSQNISVVKFQSNKLYLHTSSSAWRKEVLLRKTEIISKINEKLTSVSIVDLAI